MGTKEPRACQTHWHQNAISLSYLTPTRINPGHLWQRTRLTARLTKSLKSLTCTLASVGWLAHQFGLANRVARREAHGEKIARILMALTSPVNPVALTNLAPRLSSRLMQFAPVKLLLLFFLLVLLIKLPLAMRRSSSEPLAGPFQFKLPFFTSSLNYSSSPLKRRRSGDFNNHHDFSQLFNKILSNDDHSTGASKGSLASKDLPAKTYQ